MYKILRYTFFASTLLLASCATQNLFQSSSTNMLVGDTTFVAVNNPHIIKPDDKISVSIWNHDDLSVGSLFGIYNSNEVYGKWIIVSKDGTINLPKIGLVKLEGKNSTEAANFLQSLYKKYIKDPIIVVKVLNREVTILGEVKTQGSYLLEKETNTLVELLGRSGGFNFYADKTNVKLIRAGKEYFIDLTSMDDYNTYNFVLQSGDVIYIPTRKGKMLDKKAPTIISIASVVTSIVVILSFISSN